MMYLTNLSAQDTTNFYVIKSNFQSLYDSLRANNHDSLDSKENPFSRWVNYWEPKLCPTGDFKVWRQGFDAYITDFSNT